MPYWRPTLCLTVYQLPVLCLQLRKLEAVLNWHLEHGALQDASVLQLLTMQAAADGNAATLALLLPMFEKHKWLVRDCACLACLIWFACALRKAPLCAFPWC